MYSGPIYCPHCGAGTFVPRGASLVRCRNCSADFAAPVFGPPAGPPPPEPPATGPPARSPTSPPAPAPASASPRPRFPLWAFVTLVTLLAGVAGGLSLPRRASRPMSDAEHFITSTIGAGVVCLGGGIALAVVCRLATVRSSRGLRSAFAVGALGFALMMIYGAAPEDGAPDAAAPKASATTPATAPATTRPAPSDAPPPPDLPDVER